MGQGKRFDVIFMDDASEFLRNLPIQQGSGQGDRKGRMSKKRLF